MITLAESHHHRCQYPCYQEQQTQSQALPPLDGMGGGKRGRRQLEDEVTLRRFKKLKLHEDDHGGEDDLIPRAQPDRETFSDNCQALILRPVAPTEEAFKLAVSSDHRETFLGRRILELQQQVTLLREPMSSETPDGAGASEENKQLVVYHPPLAELIKEAAFMEEHRMQP